MDIKKANQRVWLGKAKLSQNLCGDVKVGAQGVERGG